MSPEELARAWVQTFNDGDFDTNRELGAEDGYFGITAPGRGTSHEAGVQTGQMWKAAFPDARGEVTNVVANGENVALEVTWQGTQTGDLPSLPATGKRVSVDASVFVTAHGGKIVRLMHYFDFASLLGQVGALPGPSQ